MLAQNYLKIHFHQQITLQLFHKHRIYCIVLIINKNTDDTESERYWTVPNTYFLYGRDWLVSQWVLTNHIEVSYRSCFLWLLMRISLETVWSLFPPPTPCPPVPLLYHRRKSNYLYFSHSQMNLCRSLLTAALSSRCLQTDSSVGDSNIFPNTEARLSDLRFPNSSFSTFSRDRHHVCSFHRLKKIPLSSISFRKELPAALGLLQTTSRSQKIM